MDWLDDWQAPKRPNINEKPDFEVGQMFELTDNYDGWSFPRGELVKIIAIERSPIKGRVYLKCDNGKKTQ